MATLIIVAFVLFLVVFYGMKCVSFVKGVKEIVRRVRIWYKSRYVSQHFEEIEDESTL